MGLAVAVMERLALGAGDRQGGDGHYQGISTRSRCSIYLALKTEVLAIEAALEGRVQKDFYVTDLWDIFRAVQERSKFNETVWRSPLSNGEHPTPYSYLLYQIAGDLYHLSARALQKATSRSAPPRAEAPGQVAQALALTWSCCVWRIADSQDQVSPDFRNRVIEQYLLFVLALGWQPSEIYSGPVGDNVEGLHVWRDLFLRELQARFVSGDSRERQSLQEALQSLDRGKGFISEGYTWLAENLFSKGSARSI